MVRDSSSRNHKYPQCAAGRPKRFHARDLRWLKVHHLEDTAGFDVAFHATRISEAAERLSRRDYFAWLQTEYPREVGSGNKFTELQPLESDPFMPSQDADLELLEGLLARYSPSTMVELNTDTLEVVKVILKSLRKIQTDIYIPEIRKTLQIYGIRTSLKWLYDSLYRYRGWGQHSYPEPLELIVGDRYALQAAIRYYDPQNFSHENEGAETMVRLVRAYLRWYLWKLQLRRRRGPKIFWVEKNWRTCAWRPRLLAIRE
ncbi:hypothetical protein MMC16_004616 [Acarospora aff. strigata]|nr:hypothetical protein [Acarospora aff. strigata]